MAGADADVESLYSYDTKETEEYGKCTESTLLIQYRGPPPRPQSRWRGQLWAWKEQLLRPGSVDVACSKSKQDDVWATMALDGQRAGQMVGQMAAQVQQGIVRLAEGDAGGEGEGGGEGELGGGEVRVAGREGEVGGGEEGDGGDEGGV
ncbi:hypothetical protein MBM_08958 [Drepanopeziza brunnea f. sp. 'multigermtubi' MB_m1]|uniref:Uncharacterized protein n=1 Tax=Marssonina brunnea f. sp. multigermtubi (strain MB_m1) TaxID=1072389 RepID=K1XJY7_MARBU|nr:uncharacterized protein MBM_08958 [Drepanopeziza brunnea f. sp. 'multigermtubi' MB_m1]EKD12729.1 hypothetical protein MBM_08958 [Drepanopeziza brunnea f. sp. 'multigermtubi' MB_m1]